MDSLKEMESLGLLTLEQYQEIRAYVRSPLTTRQVLDQMPQHLWMLLWQAEALMMFEPDKIPHLPMH